MMSCNIGHSMVDASNISNGASGKYRRTCSAGAVWTAARSSGEPEIVLAFMHAVLRLWSWQAGNAAEQRLKHAIPARSQSSCLSNF
jgi:hypothetical protein